MLLYQVDAVADKLSKEFSMKKLVQVSEVEGEGLVALLGKKVTLLCMNYFYTGILEGVNTTCVQLKDPSIVYETGSWNTPEYKDVQSLNVESIYVQTAAIEAFGELK